MPKASLLNLLKPYRLLVGALVLLTLISNGFNLAVPKIISKTIDSFAKGNFSLTSIITEFLIIGVCIFVFTYLQSIVQTYTSEKVARNLRTEITDNISLQDFSYIQKMTPEKLLTNITSDIDSVKMFISMAISSIISSVFLIIGISTLLLIINYKLGLAILAVIPIIGGSFYVVLKRVRKLFKKAQEAIDWLNKIINESILGAALIRLLHSEQKESEKFVAANAEAKNIGLQIIRLFSYLIPVITFATNLAVIIILSFGGHLVISQNMSIGDFTAFSSYLAILIFPILIIGFMTNIIAQASASYQRVVDIINKKPEEKTNTVSKNIAGEINVENLTVSYEQKQVIKKISFNIKPGTKTAIIGPTGAGKTQLLYALSGLIMPTEGSVSFDKVLVQDYEKKNFYAQVGIVFQDSIIFNLSIKENIAFSTHVKDEHLNKAIETAELGSFIESLPEKLNTKVSERGSSLSGGQKQRIMLARALALNPHVLLLDDFTARVDTITEKKILANIARNYPELTLISVTQKIGPIEGYDQIILLMEGEILASGRHQELLASCPEYAQIYNTQQSTNSYELQA
jgi:ATP-binding cassette subfamily B protein